MAAAPRAGSFVLGGSDASSLPSAANFREQKKPAVVILGAPGPVAATAHASALPQPTPAVDADEQYDPEELHWPESAPHTATKTAVHRPPAAAATDAYYGDYGGDPYRGGYGIYGGGYDDAYGYAAAPHGSATPAAQRHHRSSSSSRHRHRSREMPSEEPTGAAPAAAGGGSSSSHAGPRAKRSSGSRRRRGEGGAGGEFSGRRPRSKKDAVIEHAAPSTGELAAAAIELWQGLGGTGRKRSVTFGGGADIDAVAARLHEAEREAAALRHMVTEERSRIVKEVRGMRTSWEGADKRAREFEQQALVLRCAEATLTREVAHADKLTHWWRKQEADTCALAERLQLELRAAAQRSGGLQDELEQYVPRSMHTRAHAYVLPPCWPRAHACALHHAGEMTRDLLADAEAEALPTRRLLADAR